MPEVVVTTRPPEDVFEIIDSLGDVLSGDKPDVHGIRDVFWGSFSDSLMTSIHTAFIIKSQGGTDELGDKWPDLDPKTKAYSRPEARRGLPLYRGKPTKAGNKNRPTLTKEQDRQWRLIYVRLLMRLRTQMDDAEATESAAKAAWNYVKAHGATTILEYAKDRAVLLLQRSGRLERSLRPGTLLYGIYEPPDDQVFRVDQKGLTLGSSVEYASSVDKKRPLWPDHIDPWIASAVEAGIQAVIEKLKSIL